MRIPLAQHKIEGPVTVIRAHMLLRLPTDKLCLLAGRRSGDAVRNSVMLAK